MKELGGVFPSNVGLNKVCTNRVTTVSRPCVITSSTNRGVTLSLDHLTQHALQDYCAEHKLAAYYLNYPIAYTHLFIDLTKDHQGYTRHFSKY